MSQENDSLVWEVTEWSFTCGRLIELQLLVNQQWPVFDKHH